MHLMTDMRKWLLGAAGIFGLLLGHWFLNAPTTSPVVQVSVTARPRAPVQLRVVVDVTGAVRSPGVVTLPDGSRVIDAVDAAGGVKPGKRAGINLARKLVDGEQIVVGVAPSDSAAGGKVNLNSASASELEQLPGVGPVLAARIVAYRASHGPFRTLADLDAVSGVGPSIMSQIEGLASVG